MDTVKKEKYAFFYRFIVVHFITYLIFGVVFMLMSNYFEYFAGDEVFSLVMKPSDALSVRLAAPVQIIRGFLLASAIYPFRTVILQERLGWLKLFWLLFVLTGIGAVITGPGSIEGFLYTKFNFNPFIGVPEISTQMMVFSWIFCKWMRRK